MSERETEDMTAPPVDFIDMGHTTFIKLIGRDLTELSPPRTTLPPSGFLLKVLPEALLEGVSLFKIGPWWLA